MEYVSDKQSRQVTVKFRGSFTFKDNQQFRGILAILDQPDLSGISLDFAQVDFIDSAALGMLLLLREEASTRKIPLELMGATGQTLRMFAVAQFNVIFSEPPA